MLGILNGVRVAADDLVDRFADKFSVGLVAGLIIPLPVPVEDEIGNRIDQFEQVLAVTGAGHRSTKFQGKIFALAAGSVLQNKAGIVLITIVAIYIFVKGFVSEGPGAVVSGGFAERSPKLR